MLLADDCVHSSGAAQFNARRMYYAQYAGTRGRRGAPAAGDPVSSRTGAGAADRSCRGTGRHHRIGRGASNSDDGAARRHHCAGRQRRSKPDRRADLSHSSSAARAADQTGALGLGARVRIALAGGAAAARKRPRLNLRGPDVDDCLREPMANAAAWTRPTLLLRPPPIKEARRPGVWCVTAPTRCCTTLHDWRDALLNRRACGCDYRASLLDDAAEAVRQADLG